jgi:DNA polymerase III gamma/tau subunit
VALAQKFSEEDLMRFLDILLQLHQQLRHSMEPRFQTELGLLKLVDAGRLVAIEELLANLSTGAERREAASRPPSSFGEPAASPPRRPASHGTEHAGRAPGLSPFEQDTLRKKMAPAGPDASAEDSEGHGAAAQASSPEPQAATGPHTDPHSREANWAHEVLRHLEERQRFGLASMLEGAQWEFGEREVRIRTAGAGIAKAMPEQDRQTLEQLISETMGHKIRLSLAEEPPAGAIPVRGRRAAKAPSKAASATDPEVEARVRQDPEVREFEQLFGKPVSGIRRWKE